MVSRKLRVLIVDDDELMGQVLTTRLKKWGCQPWYASNTAAAVKMADELDLDVILSDVVMPGIDGLALLRKLKAGETQRQVVLMTGHATVDMAVHAMKEGADDFLTKPLDYSALRALLDAVREERIQRRRAERLEAEVQNPDSAFQSMIGKSEPMLRVYDLIRKVAATNASVLITGESGTGKELTARAIHDLSGRAQGPFLALNVAAIPRELMESELFGHEKGAFTGASDRKSGCFEQTDGGTLFLDEIGEMPALLQPKLLRVLEDGRVRRLGAKKENTFDVRVLAATNRDPSEAVEEGALRQDLYYRLNVFHIELPPLRQREEDLVLLAQHFQQKFNEKHGVQLKGLRDSTLATMQAYHWPGNVRELRNVMERAVVLAGKGWIEPSHLPPALHTTQRREAVVLPKGTTIADAERELILQTYEATGRNKSETARRVGLDVKTVRAKLKSYGMG